MQTQTTELTAAARAPQRRPYLAVVVEDHELRFAELWRGGDSALNVAACCGAQDASKIIRVRRNGANIDTQVITDPGVAAQWSTWTTQRTDANTASHVAIGRGEGNNLHLYYWKSGSPSLLCCLISPDDGATWGTWHSLVSTSYPGNYLVATAGVADCWYVEGSPLRVKHRVRSGGAWGGAQTCGAFVNIQTPRGLCAAHDAVHSQIVFAFAYATADTGNPGRLCVNYYNTAAAGYAAPSTVYTIHPPGANVNALQPATLAMCYTGEGRLFLAALEVWTDGANTARSVVLWECLGSAADHYHWWGRPLLSALTPTTTAQIALLPRVESDELTNTRHALYLMGNAEARAARTYHPDHPECRLITLAVTAFHLAESETERRGWIDLAYQPGLWANLGARGVSGNPLRPLALVYLRTGYYVGPSTAHYLSSQPYHLESVELMCDPGMAARIRLHLVSGWRLLEQWHAPHPLAAAGASALWNLQRLFALAVGRIATTDGDAVWASVVANHSLAAGRRAAQLWRWRREWVGPEYGLPRAVYQIAADTSGLVAVWRLLNLVGGKLRWGALGAPHLVNLKAQPTTPVDYEIGTAGEIVAAAYGVAATGVSRARITANSGAIAVEHSDPATAEALGRLIESHDTRDELALAAVVAEACRGQTDEGRREGCAGWVRIPLVPGLELWDRVAISDARAGLSAAPRRVTALAWEYDAARSVYHQTVALGGLS